MEEIAWETQAHFIYDMECNIEGVPKMLGYNFKSEFSTKKICYYMSANSYQGTDRRRHIINTNTTDAIQNKIFPCLL
jgi:hypothetical protein